MITRTITYIYSLLPESSSEMTNLISACAIGIPIVGLVIHMLYEFFTTLNKKE